jgi:alpha-ribazole phosphatase
MARLLLVRHGKIEGEENRYYGHIDIGLSEEGVKQAEMLRDRLASENLKATYSSDLKRAFDTAEIIAAAHKLKVTPCSDLREFDFGELAGMTFEEIEKRYEGAVELLSGQDPNMSAPGGESLRQMSARIKRFVAQVEKLPPERTVLVVAHDGSLKVLLCILLGMSSEHWWQFRLDPASLTVAETYPEGAVLCLLNDTSHLGGVRR